MLYCWTILGVNGYDGDGDITRPDNLIAFREYVMSQTDGRGVHFVMGDGVSVDNLSMNTSFNVVLYCKGYLGRRS